MLLRWRGAWPEHTAYSSLTASDRSLYISVLRLQYMTTT